MNIGRYADHVGTENADHVHRISFFLRTRTHNWFQETRPMIKMVTVLPQRQGQRPTHTMITMVTMFTVLP